MKKTIITIAIIFGITFGGFAQEKGLFGRAPQEGYGYSLSSRDDPEPGQSVENFGLPTSHGQDNDQPAPVGSGALLLIGFGAAYALKKRKSH